MEQLLHVKGFKELAEFLDDVPKRMRNSIVRGALRAGMAVVKPVAKQRIHSVSGLLAKGLKISTGIDKNGNIYAKLKATGPHAHVASWVEYGTHTHIIHGVVAFRDGNVRKDINHPGARPHPFMRPALDGCAAAMLIAAGNYMKSRLSDKRTFMSDQGVEVQEAFAPGAASIDVGVR